MNNNHLLFCIIVDFGEANKMLKTAKKLGVRGGTFILGKGTVGSHLLNILGFYEVRKEILIMIIDEELEDSLFKELNEKFHLDKPHHGIAFTIPANSCMGLRNSRDSKFKLNHEVTEMRYESIFTIVDKDNASKVLEAAKSVGSTGGTIIHGRGSGTREKQKLFDFEIDPEKDIVLILAKAEQTDAIVNSIKEKLNLDTPGNGIIFVLDVNRTLGIFEE